MAKIIDFKTRQALTDLPSILTPRRLMRYGTPKGPNGYELPHTVVLVAVSHMDAMQAYLNAKAVIGQKLKVG